MKDGSDYMNKRENTCERHVLLYCYYFKYIVVVLSYE